LTTKYLYGDNVDELLARIDGTTPAWYLTDRRVRCARCSTTPGAIADSLSYDGFGNIDTGSELDPT